MRLTVHLFLFFCLCLSFRAFAQVTFIPASHNEWKKVQENPESLNDTFFTYRELHHLPYYRNDEMYRTCLPYGTYIKVSGNAINANADFFEVPPFQESFTYVGFKAGLVLLSDSLKPIETAIIRYQRGKLSYDPELRAYPIPIHFFRDTLHIYYEGVHYLRYLKRHIRYYNDNPFTPKRSGYVICSQPQYRLGDTLRVKAYLIKGTRTIKRNIYARIKRQGSSSKKKFWTYKLKAVSPGAFEFKIPLGDSLKTNTTYQIDFTKFKKSRYNTEDWSAEFQLNDYQFSKINWQVKPLYNIHRSGNNFSFLVSAIDPLGLPAYGAFIDLKAEFTHIGAQYAPKVSIPPKFFSSQTEIKESKPFLIEIPDSAFSPDIDFGFTVTAEIKHPSGFYEKRLFDFEHKAKPLPFNFEVTGNLLRISNNKGFSKDSIKLTLHYKYNRNYTVYAHLPFECTLSEDLMDLRIHAGYADISLKEYLTPAPVDLYFKEYPDSVEVNIKNPSEHFTMVRSGIHNRFGNSFSSTTMDTTFTLYRNRKNQDIFIHITYFNREGTQIITKTFHRLKKRLFIEHSIPQWVNAGSNRSDSIIITDYKGRPVKNVNLTVLSLDNRFDQEHLRKWPVEFYSYSRNKIKDYYIEPVSERSVSFKMSLLKGPLFNTFRKRLPGLNFKMNLIEGYFPNPENLTGIVPVFIKDIPYKPIYIQVNDSLIHSFAFGEKFPFLTDPGIYKIALRANEHIFRFDSVKVEKGKLTLLIASLENEHSNGSQESIAKLPDTNEIRLILRNYQHLYRQGSKRVIRKNDTIKLEDTPNYISQGRWIKRLASGDSILFTSTHSLKDTVLSAHHDIYKYEGFSIRGYDFEPKSIDLFTGIWNRDYYSWRTRPMRHYDYPAAPEKSPPAINFDTTSDLLPWAGNLDPLSPQDTGKGNAYIFRLSAKEQITTTDLRAIILTGDSIPKIRFIRTQPKAWTMQSQLPFEVFAKSWGGNTNSYHISVSDTSKGTHIYQLDNFKTAGKFPNDGFTEYIKPQQKFRDWTLQVNPMKINLVKNNLCVENAANGIKFQFSQHGKKESYLQGSLYLVNALGEFVALSLLDSEGLASFINLKPGKYIPILYTSSHRIPLPLVDLKKGKYFRKHYGITKQDVISELPLIQKTELREVLITHEAPLIDGAKTIKTFSRESIAHMAVRDISSVSGKEVKPQPLEVLKSNDPAHTQALIPPEFKNGNAWQRWSGETRSDFRETAVWKANLTTDHQGRVIFNNTWPGNLTTWSNHVFAAKKHNSAGYAQSFTRGIKPLGTQIILPGFVVSGDQFEVPFQVTNLTGTRRNYSFTVKQNGEEIFQKDTAVNTLTQFTIPFKAGTDTLSLVSELSTPEEYHDGEAREIIPLPKGIHRREGETFVLEKNKPRWIVAGSIPVYVEINKLNTQLARSEIRYLSSYAHGCNEQMSNRLRALLINQLLGEKPLIFNQNREIRKLIRLLEANQNGDGLWGWWHVSATNYVISNIVLDAFQLASAAGFTIKAMHGIQNQFKNLVKPTIDQLHSLEHLNMLSKHKKYIAEYPCEDDACLIEIGRFKQALGLPFEMDSLIRTATLTPYGGYQWRLRKNYFKNEFYYTMLMATLLSKSKHHEKEFVMAIQGVLEFRGAGFYVNTRNAGMYISFLKTIENAKPSWVKIISEKVEDSIYISGASKKFLLEPGDSLQLSKSGDEPVFIYSYSDYFDTIPSPNNKFFDLKANWITQDSASNTLAFQTQSTLKVHFTKPDSQAFRYMMLEVPIPSGCRFDQSSFQKPKNATCVEFFRDRCVIYYHNLPRYPQEISFNVFSEFKGSFIQNVVRLRSMYNKDIDDFTGLKKITIK